MKGRPLPTLSKGTTRRLIGAILTVIGKNLPHEWNKKYTLVFTGLPLKIKFQEIPGGFMGFFQEKYHEFLKKSMCTRYSIYPRCHHGWSRGGKF